MGKTERESATSPTESAPSLDLIFALLANQRRRYALYYLFTQSNGVAAADAIASAVCTLEERVTGQTVSQAQVRTALQHVHFPKLEEAGVVEYDPRSETVRYWDTPSVEEWLEHAYYLEITADTRSMLEVSD